VRECKQQAPQLSDAARSTAFHPEKAAHTACGAGGNRQTKGQADAPAEVLVCYLLAFPTNKNLILTHQ
jgi:hypothetical protein